MDATRTVLVAVMLLVSPAAERPAEIPLWPAGAPGSEGKPASGELSVSAVHNPSITPYLPAKDKAAGLAILVIPGGAHRVLAITHEGYNVAESAVPSRCAQAAWHAGAATVGCAVHPCSA